MDEFPDTNAAADEEAELLKQMPFPGNPVNEGERLTCWLRLPRRARVLHQATTSQHETLAERRIDPDAACCTSSTELHQRCQACSMPAL